MSSDFIRMRLSQELEQALRGMMTPMGFPEGATLYQHGTPAAGIYLVEKGSVRVLLPIWGQQHQLLEVVGPGTVLGLSDSMAGELYRITAQAQEPTRALFVPRQTFLDFLGDHHEYCMQIVRLLSDDLHGLYHKFRSVSAHPGRPRRRSLDESLS